MHFSYLVRIIVPVGRRIRIAGRGRGVARPGRRRTAGSSRRRVGSRGVGSRRRGGIAGISGIGAGRRTTGPSSWGGVSAGCTGRRSSGSSRRGVRALRVGARRRGAAGPSRRRGAVSTQGGRADLFATGSSGRRSSVSGGGGQGGAGCLLGGSDGGGSLVLGLGLFGGLHGSSA